MSDLNQYSSMTSSNSILETNNNEVSIKIMQYNVQMLKTPRCNLNWWKRGSYVIDHVLTLQRELDFDVIVFNEVFFKRFYDDLQKSLYNQFPYNSPVVNGKLNTDVDEIFKPVRGVNGKINLLPGGVVIFSKYPIMESHQMVFNDSTGAEGLCAKGAILAKVLKNGRYFNIVGTHLQSGIHEKDHSCRMKQAKQLSKWIRTGLNTYTDSMSGSLEMGKVQVETVNNKVTSLEHMNTIDVYKVNPGSSLDKSLSCSKTFQRCKDQKLPRGVINISDPLIFVGDFNIRYEEDNKWLLAVLDPECLNADLVLDTRSHMVNTYDSSANDYCKFINKDRSLQYKDILDYFFLSKESNAVVKSHQQTIDREFAGEINITKFLFVIPLKRLVVHHPSDHFPIVAEFTARKL